MDICPFGEVDRSIQAELGDPATEKIVEPRLGYLEAPSRLCLSNLPRRDLLPQDDQDIRRMVMLAAIAELSSSASQT